MSDAVSNYERRIEAMAAFDKRHPDPSKNYGIHGVEFRFSLIGEKAAASFGISTGWLLPRTLGLDEASSTRYRRVLGERDAGSGSRLDPTPMGLHFHVAEPLADYMTASTVTYCAERDRVERVVAGCCEGCGEPAEARSLACSYDDVDEALA